MPDVRCQKIPGLHASLIWYTDFADTIDFLKMAAAQGIEAVPTAPAPQGEEGMEVRADSPTPQSRMWF
ncbi:MAG: hypothetical protein ACK4TA_03705 [Saprospiraceae bacterium]